MKKEFVKKILEMLQTLDEMGGPDSPEEYVEILEEISLAISIRVEAAKSTISKRDADISKFNEKAIKHE